MMVPVSSSCKSANIPLKEGGGGGGGADNSSNKGGRLAPGSQGKENKRKGRRRPRPNRRSLADARSALKIWKTTKPGKFDVLLGRGKQHTNHPGNRRMLVLVNIHKRRYRESVSNKEKIGITEDIVHQIKCCGTEQGKFLRRAACDEWYEVDDETARVKVAHALRYRQLAAGDDSWLSEQSSSEELHQDACDSDQTALSVQAGAPAATTSDSRLKGNSDKLSILDPDLLSALRIRLRNQGLLEHMGTIFRGTDKACPAESSLHAGTEAGRTNNDDGMFPPSFSDRDGHQFDDIFNDSSDVGVTVLSNRIPSFR